MSPLPYMYSETMSYNRNSFITSLIRDHQGNNRLVVDGSDNIEQTNKYFPYGGPWGGSDNQGFQPYKYNGKELDHVHGLDWYDYGARRYDPAYCLFTQMDPLAEKYPHLSPYVYCAGNPVNYVDPDGKLVIFINGFAPKMDGGKKQYWPSRFVSDVMSHFNESRTPLFRDGSIGSYFGLLKGSSNMFKSSLNPFYRNFVGYLQGSSEAEQIIKSLRRDENGEINESIRIVTHSMGGAYAKGYAKALVRYVKEHPNLSSGISISEYDFAPFQPSFQSAVQGVDTYQYSHLLDPVAKYMPIWGATMMQTDVSLQKGHFINSFLQYISTLPEGTYKFVDGNLVKQ